MANKLATIQVCESIRADCGDDMKDYQQRVVKMICEALDTPPNDKKHVSPYAIHWGQLWEELVNYDRRLDVATSDLSQIAEATVASSFPVAMKKAIHNVWIPEYVNNLMGVDNLVEEVDSDREEENITGILGIDEPDLVHDGEGVPEADMKEKYAQIKNYLFQKAIRFTRHTLMFDKSGGKLLNRAKTYGEKMGIHRHRFIVEKTLDYAVTATGEAAGTAFKYKGSAHAMYQSDHSSLEGQTNKNAITTSFGTAGMKEAVQLLALMKDEAGSETPVLPDTILCSSFLMTDAIELVKAPGRYDSANRTVNPFGPAGLQTLGMGYTGFNVVASPIIDNSDATSGKYRWALGAFKKNMRWQWVKKPTVEQIPGDLMQNIIVAFVGMYWGGCGAVDYRNAVRSHATS